MDVFMRFRNPKLNDKRIAESLQDATVIRFFILLNQFLFTRHLMIQMRHQIFR